MHALVLTATVVLSGCTAMQLQQTQTAVAEVLISDDQEFQLGLQVHDELKKQNTKFNEDPTVGVYVEGLAKKVLATAGNERKLEWMWFVIDDPNTINAFATPGGRIYVYTGLLLAAENEAEIIGVLGHEVGHVVGRHSARQLVGSKGLEVVANMALGKESGEVAKLAAALAGKTAMLAYGRDMELEADQFGARYSSTAGYDPHALGTFFEKLKAKYGDAGPVMTFFSTHPASSDRITRINAFITEQNLTGKELGTEQLKVVQAKLGKK